MRRGLSFVPIGLAMVLLGAPSVGFAADSAPPVITHVPVSSAHAGESVAITAHIQDESQIFGATLWFRKVGATTFSSTDLTHQGDVWVGKIPAVSGDVQYWIEAYDEFGNGPARAGSPEHPYTIKVGAPVATPPPVVAAPVKPAPKAPAAVAPAPKSKHESDDEDWAEQDQFSTGKKQAPAAATAAPVPSGPPVPYYQQWWFGTTIGVVGAGVVATVVYFLIPKPVYRDVFAAKLVPGT